jgi:1,4-alpha-glucan branching enzyme
MTGMRQAGFGIILAVTLLSGRGVQASGAPLGAVLDSQGAQFNVWAPHAQSVTVEGSFNAWSPTADPLRPAANGYWVGYAAGARTGDQYLYHILGPNGAVDRRDPAGRLVTTAAYGVGRSILYDSSAFAWGNDASFRRPAGRDLIIYELHIGTFNAPQPGVPGTFADAIARLDHIVALGATAVEVLPVNESPGVFFTGYGPAEVFAVANKAYGGPDGFKQFVRACHERGLAVILDVVHNHWGPWDLDLNQFDGWYTPTYSGGIFFYGSPRLNSPWGPRPDYALPQVRREIIDSLRAWVGEDHVDGFRWDSTSNIDWTDSGGGLRLPQGWSLMQAANTMLHQEFPGRISIAEDFLNRASLSQPVAQGGAAFDSQWSYLVSPLRAALTAASDSNRQLGPITAAIDAIYNGQALQRVVYSESHNETAPPGARLTVEIDPADPSSWQARKRSTLGALVAFTVPGIAMLWQGQDFLDPGHFVPRLPVDWSWLQREPGIFALYHDLIALRLDRSGTTEGLRGNHVDVFHEDDTRKVLAWWRWDRGGADDDTVVVTNFSGVALTETIGMPHTGLWVARFNSDDRRYSPDYGDVGSATANATGSPADGLAASAVVTIAPYSAIVFSQG